MTRTEAVRSSAAGTAAAARQRRGRRHGRNRQDKGSGVKRSATKKRNAGCAAQKRAHDGRSGRRKGHGGGMGGDQKAGAIRAACHPANAERRRSRSVALAGWLAASPCGHPPAHPHALRPSAIVRPAPRTLHSAVPDPFT